jgi:hypothetical protein
VEEADPTQLDAGGDTEAGTRAATPKALAVATGSVHSGSDAKPSGWSTSARPVLTAGDALDNIDGYYEQLSEGGLQAGPFLARGDSSFQQGFAGEDATRARHLLNS